MPLYTATYSEDELREMVRRDVEKRLGFPVSSSEVKLDTSVSAEVIILAKSLER